jgi:hypothetical protein
VSDPFVHTTYHWLSWRLTPGSSLICASLEILARLLGFRCQCTHLEILRLPRVPLSTVSRKTFITKDVIEEDLRQVLYGLQQGFHPCILTPGADKWKYSLGLYELTRGYRSLEYDPRLFQIAYELVKEDLHDKVQRDLLLFAKWRLGDPIQHPHLILSILTLCLSAKIEVQLPEGLIIAGTLESVNRCGDDMVALVVQCCDDRVLVITEPIERAPFLWTGDRTVTTVSLPVERRGLPPYLFAVLTDMPRRPVPSTR